MYKMEFFTDSFDSAYSQSPSEAQPSQMSEEDKESKASWAKRSHAKDEKKVVNNQGVVE